MNAFTNRDALQGSAYADDAKLAARQAIYRFLERRQPTSRGRVREVVELRGDETVVDVGCGNGNDSRQLRAGGHTGTILGFDLSVGMLRALDAGVPAANADAASLPLRDGAADVALAMHMLYHCPDIPATVAELRRVVRRGGVLAASTNSVDHLVELGDALSSAVAAAGGTPRRWGEGPARFSLEHGGEVLARSFATVERHEDRNRLLVTDLDAVIAYVQSVRDLYGDESDDVWDQAVETLGERVADEIREHGAFAISTATGTFVCR